MTTFHQQADNVMAFIKGAPERVVPQCHTAISVSGAPTSWPAEQVLEQAEQMAADGRRVLAIACRTWPQLPPDPAPATVERGLTFLGLVGLLDPPRQEAQKAVALCQSAGIILVIITGDHPATARAIATRLGIVTDDAAMTSNAGESGAFFWPRSLDFQSRSYQCTFCGFISSPTGFQAWHWPQNRKKKASCVARLDRPMRAFLPMACGSILFGWDCSWAGSVSSPRPGPTIRAWPIGAR